MAQIAVIGDSEVEDEREIEFAERLGFELARRGHVIICGGRGGVMEAVAKGARMAGGIVVGILPGADKREGNPYLTVVIPTGLGWARNAVVALSGDVVIAIGGRSGTLSEIAYAWMYGKPIIAVVGFGGWSERLAGGRIDERRGDKIIPARTVEEVLNALEKLVGIKGG